MPHPTQSSMHPHSYCSDHSTLPGSSLSLYTVSLPRQGPQAGTHPTALIIAATHSCMNWSHDSIPSAASEPFSVPHTQIQVGVPASCKQPECRSASSRQTGLRGPRGTPLCPVTSNVHVIERLFRKARAARPAPPQCMQRTVAKCCCCSQPRELLSAQPLDKTSTARVALAPCRASSLCQQPVCH